LVFVTRNPATEELTTNVLDVGDLRTILFTACAARE
jgi:hypothetical protein